MSEKSIGGKMMESVGTGLAGGAVGSILGMVGAGGQQKRQKELMDKQMKNQMTLNRDSQALNLDYWNKTNYGAQVEHMKNAGLNVGLMYEGGGAGGQSGSAGGSATGGQAVAQETGSQQLGMGMQMAMMKAQVENLNADTTKKEVEAGKLGGADTDAVNAGTELTRMKTKNEEILKNVNQGTWEEQIMKIRANADEAQSNARKAVVGANVTEQTQGDTTQQIKNEAIKSGLEIALAESKIQLNEAQIQNMVEQIKLGKYNAEKISSDQVQGKLLNIVMEKVAKGLGVDITTTK